VLASWREGFPTVIGEAMACGTPVASSRVGAVEEMVIDGVTGWLYPSRDDEALVAVLANIISNPDLAASMRPGVRIVAEQRISPRAVTGGLKACFDKGN
jgi:glycosyltransferase involved in cell wall biosynthesis